MTKVDKLVNHFPQYLQMIYPMGEHSAESAARLVASHLLLLTLSDMHCYIRHFFALYGVEYKIFTACTDEKQAVVNFMEMVGNLLPQNTDEINPSLRVFLSKVPQDLVNHIVNYCKIKEYAKDHISFTEILNHPDKKIKSILTIKQLVKKLGIHVIALDKESIKGKFISHADHQRIFDVYKPLATASGRIYSRTKA